MKTFIEIGACDFNNLDIYLDKGRVIFVEPIPEYRESLKRKIGNHSNAVFEDSAISSYDGFLDMTYILPDTAADWWVKGISHASFSSSNLINRNIQQGFNIGTPASITVPCLTLNSFLSKHQVEEIELLQIDVEGHEMEILGIYDWKIKPKQLKIEHKFNDVNIMTKLLTEKGYAVYPDEEDIYAILVKN